MNTSKIQISVFNSVLFILLLFSTQDLLFGQNSIAVPFETGFVGNNSGNNSASGAVLMGSLGWSNFQFSQFTSTAVFVSQGNDIVGSVLITDANGIEHTISGSIKWRAPSGTATTVVFTPSQTSVLNTSGGGTYTVNTTKYIGLIFNGKSLTINSGSVNGNAAGSVDALNGYLGTLPDISTIDYVVSEGAGSFYVTVSLSNSSSQQIKVSYSSSDGTATNSLDYTIVSGLLIFDPGQTTKTITIPVSQDILAESVETFSINLTDPVNASIIKNTSNISILDNPPLPIELLFFEASCDDGKTTLTWATGTESNNQYFKIERKTDLDWIEIVKIIAVGNSSESSYYTFQDVENIDQTKYYRLSQTDMDGKEKLYNPTAIICSSQDLDFSISPNPNSGTFNLIFASFQPIKATIKMLNTSGMILFEDVVENDNNSAYQINNENWKPGIYYIEVKAFDKAITRKIIIE